MLHVSYLVLMNPTQQLVKVLFIATLIELTVCCSTSCIYKSCFKLILIAVCLDFHLLNYLGIFFLITPAGVYGPDSNQL